VIRLGDLHGFVNEQRDNEVIGDREIDESIDSWFVLRPGKTALRISINVSGHAFKS